MIGRLTRQRRRLAQQQWGQWPGQPPPTTVAGRSQPHGGRQPGMGLRAAGPVAAPDPAVASAPWRLRALPVCASTEIELDRWLEQLLPGGEDHLPGPLAVIARRTPLDGATLAAAIVATFARRQTALPTERPLALSRAFSEDTAKLRQWQAFLNKNRIQAESLGDTVALLADLLWPPTQVAAAGSAATATWRPEALRWV